MKAQSCTHVRITGHRCGSPALRGQPYCYFHDRLLNRRPEPPGDTQLHPIALIESEESVQAALMQVIDALMKDTIDTRRASLIIKALYIASLTARRARFDANPEDMVISCGADTPVRHEDAYIGTDTLLGRPAQPGLLAPQESQLLTAREAERLEEMQAMDRWATAVRDGNLAEINKCLEEMSGNSP